MNPYYGSPGPPRTLAERLSRLNDGLQTLGERLKASIAGLVGDAIADAVRDSVRGLLGSKDSPTHPHHDPYGQPHRPYQGDHTYGTRDDPWGEEDRRWSGEDDESYRAVRESPGHQVGTGRRWRDAMSAAVQTCLWFLKRQPRRRPVLTTLAVTLAAGVTGFVAGPALAAGAGVLASVAGLLLTAGAAGSAAGLASG